MDTLTHIVAGVCLGEMVAGRQLGRKAGFIGAAANSIPDLDFVTAFWLDIDDNLLAHRGFTHSLLFAAIVTVIGGFLLRRWFRKRNLSLYHSMMLIGTGLFYHLLIDAFNAYGTAWFEPFSHKRISFNTLFVADPFYSVWPAVAAVVLLWRRKWPDRQRIFWLQVGLGISTLYIFYCLANKTEIDSVVKQNLRRQQISYTQYLSTPTPLNNWLWFVAAGNDSGFYVGHYSILDDDREIDFQFFPRNESLLTPLKDHEEVRNLRRFSQGFYTVESRGDSTVFNDLRFGQITGWHDPKAGFVFYYYLQHPDANTLVVQRGRFARWNRETLRSLIKSIAGN